MVTIPFAVIIPVLNEQEVLGITLREWIPPVAAAGGQIAVGINGARENRDHSCKIAETLGVWVGSTERVGYGEGCLAAMEALRYQAIQPEAYVFVAADGANSPEDLSILLEASQNGEVDMVLGQRTGVRANRQAMGAFQWYSNRFLGASCFLWCGRGFRDLGPFRWIRRDLLERMNVRELEYGFTIETQVLAVRLGGKIKEVHVIERRRKAGVQKISGGPWLRRAKIGLKILVAGWKCRKRSI